jgi:uncharacterized protein (DUF433 family)
MSQIQVAKCLKLENNRYLLTNTHADQFNLYLSVQRRDGRQYLLSPRHASSYAAHTTARFEHNIHFQSRFWLCQFGCQAYCDFVMTMEELKGIVHSDPEVMGGALVFVGTRVPLQNLIDALEGDESIEEFLVGFPSVKRSQAIAVIEAGQLKMLETVGHAYSH